MSRKNLELLGVVLLVLLAIYVPQVLGMPVWVPIVAAALIAGLSAFMIRGDPPANSN